MKKVALALVLVLAAAVSAPAATYNLGDSGWQISYDDSLNPYLTLGFEVNAPGDTIVMQKILNITPEFVNQRGFVEPITIVFKQTSYSAKSLVLITEETVTNNTGYAWDGFRMQALDGSTGTATDTRFDVGASADFTIDPFTQRTYSQNNQVLDLFGGIVNNGDVWMPGHGLNGGELVISAAPVTSGALKTFVFKEQPRLTVIPLPAAAWTGLSGLAGLSLVGFARKVRSLIA